VATGETVAEVELEMIEAIGFHLDGMREDGITPEPTSIVDYVNA
jgi:predicted RNase H-like HicB family nuclease